MTETSRGRAVVVGVEATESGRAAVDWAAEQAARRRVPLRLVRALEWPAGAPRPQHAGEPRHSVNLRTHAGQSAPDKPATLSPPLAHGWGDRFHKAAVTVLDDASESALQRHPDLELEAALIDGPPVDVLRAESENAAMVVLGSRHLSSAAELLTTGSVAVPVAAHAHCPVAVVRGAEPADAATPALVVGVDGSERSEPALAYAFEEAARRGAILQAVIVTRPIGFATTAEADQDARRLLAESLAGWKDKHPDVVVRPQVAHGHAVRALVEASRDTLGLVVGTRGLGGFAGMVLGSVSHGVLHHAACPVIVVPAPEDGPTTN
ncbi:MAG TPA: universal stress protein [Yinghuangia sp.]|nr:universal stress protein [Yinghuangia sp.]